MQKIKFSEIKLQLLNTATTQSEKRHQTAMK